jgi:hypothetical protein
VPAFVLTTRLLNDLAQLPEKLSNPDFLRRLEKEEEEEQYVQKPKSGGKNKLRPAKARVRCK